MGFTDWLSLIFGIVNVIQFGIAMTTDGTLRIQKQVDYYNWHQVGELAGQLKQDPQCAKIVAEALIKLSHSKQVEIAEFAQGKLGFTPFLQTPWAPRKDTTKVGVFSKIILAFQPK